MTRIGHPVIYSKPKQKIFCPTLLSRGKVEVVPYGTIHDFLKRFVPTSWHAHTHIYTCTHTCTHTHRPDLPATEKGRRTGTIPMESLRSTGRESCVSKRHGHLGEENRGGDLTIRVYGYDGHFPKKNLTYTSRRDQGR